jgi:DNA-binding LacI/PurR family transcriptional regulator
MEDVAALAGVSVATVSRALRDSPLVSAATRQKVLHAAGELDFAVFRPAAALASGRVGRIAVLISGQVQGWFNGAALDGLYDGLRAADQELAVYRVTNLAERETFFATLPVRRNADALVVTSFALTADERERLNSIGMPLVYVNQIVDDAASVSIDDVEATRLGIRSTSGIAGPRSPGSTIERVSPTARWAGWTATGPRLPPRGRARMRRSCSGRAAPTTAKLSSPNCSPRRSGRPP